MSSPQLLVADLGTVPYADALEFQRAVARARISGAIAEDVLLLVEHPPVITLGRSTKAQHLTTSAAVLESCGVEVHEVERGGDVTFHGPGQLVGYPVVDLKRHRRDLHWYLRQVEEALIGALATVGVAGERNAGFTGVWVGGGRSESGGGRLERVSASIHQGATSTLYPPRSHLRKIASIGVHARDWVTWHGFALNVTTDLAYFDLIVPCGISGVTMTSVARELAPAACEAGAVRREVAAAFGRLFALAPLPVSGDSLAARLDQPAAAAR